MSIFKEFREFIARGNVIDLAVGVIIGAAFNKIVGSLVDQVIMPPIGLLLGRVDFNQLKWVLQPAGLDAKAHPEVAIQYGAFINTLIQFVIVAFVVFLLVKAVNTLRREQEAAPEPEAAPTPSEALLVEIRDLLKTPPKPVAAPAVAAPAPSIAKAEPKPAVAKPAAKASPAKAATKAPARKPPAKPKA